MDAHFDRNLMRLLASGKYLDLNKSFEQQHHHHFVEGALFAVDYILKKERELKLSKKEGILNEMVNEDLD